MDPDYRVVYIANGSLDAEEIRMFLESAGIPSYVNQESIGMSGYSVVVGPLGEAKVYVSAERFDEARQLLDQMDRGELETNEDLSEGESVEDDEDNLKE
jgi:pentatricopeptide repeat protein